jgi:hypothetical protein
VSRRTFISHPTPRWRDSVASIGFARGIFLLLFAALLPAGALRAAEHFPATDHPATSALRATFDDFDGDFRPDQIDVQTGNSEFSGTQYWIELRMSTTGRQMIPVFSLPGGLQVVARDVNGDRTLDLILTTKSLRRPVAILLNDGHGRFTRAEAEAFPKAFQDAGTSWESRDHSVQDCADFAPSSRSLVVLASSGWSMGRSIAGRIAPSQRFIVVRLKAAPDAGRAPPVLALL